MSEDNQDEDIIIIHLGNLGRVVSDEVYDQIVKDIVRLLEKKYPSNAKRGQEMSKDFRCKDCQWWKDSGMICTKLYVHAGDLAKKCKHFKLKENEQH